LIGDPQKATLLQIMLVHQLMVEHMAFGWKLITRMVFLFLVTRLSFYIKHSMQNCEWQSGREQASQVPRLCTYHNYQMLLEKDTQDWQETNNKVEMTSIGLFYL
jgi:hypothetical protein